MYAARNVDAVIFALLPTILLAVAGVVLIERLRIREGADRYQFREYRPDKDREHGNGNHGTHRNGSGPGGR